ncbi:MAG: hypothetical protein ACJ8MR_05455, partial [Povalibacter sp.]
MASSESPTFDDCARGVEAQPAAYESYRCYYEIASSTGEWRKASAHLAALESRTPGIDWILFMRAAVTWPLDKTAAEALYETAAARFQQSENAKGEILARANLSTLYFESGRIPRAAREVARVSVLGERAADIELRMRARI